MSGARPRKTRGVFTGIRWRFFGCRERRRRSCIVCCSRREVLKQVLELFSHKGAYLFHAGAIDAQIAIAGP